MRLSQWTQYRSSSSSALNPTEVSRILSHTPHSAVGKDDELGAGSCIICRFFYSRLRGARKSNNNGRNELCLVLGLAEKRCAEVRIDQEARDGVQGTGGETPGC